MEVESIGYILGFVTTAFLLAWLVIFLMGIVQGKNEHIALKVFVLGLAFLLVSGGGQILEMLPESNERDAKSKAEISELISGVNEEGSSTLTAETPLGIIYQRYINNIDDLYLNYDQKLEQAPSIHLNSTQELKDLSIIQSYIDHIEVHREIDNEFFKNFIALAQQYGSEIESLDSESIFETGFQEGTAEEIPIMVSELETMSSAANTYYNAYSKYYQFIITEQPNIALDGDEVIIETEALLLEYQILLDTVEQTETEYFALLEQFQQAGIEGGEEAIQLFQ